MDSRTFGRVTLTLPCLDEPGRYLSNIPSLDSGRGIVQDFRYSDADLRSLNLMETQLISGKITGLRAARVHLNEVKLHSVEFDGCDLASATWRNSKLSRVVFRNCKIMGASLTGLTMDDVLVENCRLDYSTLEKLRATGPVVFSRCVFTEASLTDCDLTAAVLDDCTLRLTDFGKGRYGKLDLRGNDLSSVRGVAQLAKVIIDRSQEHDLLAALLAELEVTYGDDLDAPR
ncbi:pentapeptide repeat-containing protein [Streptomyces cucumeris]|uniref:pentapeptide repeat-containing protein n=1 Tax=Streptomyces cucumeris TaxID=2962890 RepID=UPI003D702908